MLQTSTSDVQGEDYRIWYDSSTQTTHMQGLLRLSGKAEYQPIVDLLTTALATAHQFTLDLTELEFLNSSGITVLTMFVVKVRQRGDVPLEIVGSERILWQTKSLRNLQRLMPSLTLSWE